MTLFLQSIQMCFDSHDAQFGANDTPFGAFCECKTQFDQPVRQCMTVFSLKMRL